MRVQLLFCYMPFSFFLACFRFVFVLISIFIVVVLLFGYSQFLTRFPLHIQLIKFRYEHRRKQAHQQPFCYLSFSVPSFWNACEQTKIRYAFLNNRNSHVRTQTQTEKATNIYHFIFASFLFLSKCFCHHRSYDFIYNCYWFRSVFSFPSHLFSVCFLIDLDVSEWTIAKHNLIKKIVSFFC